MKNKLRVNIPEEVKIILSRIKSSGAEAYVVGGCVRDSLLGKEPNDWDVTTSLTPDKVLELFSDFNLVEKGIEYGTVSIFINDVEYEITTFRKEAGSKDCRHPEQVTFSNSIEEDLERRDFTINAMAYNNEVGLVDPYNGFEDLNKGILRAVGNPNERFKEDALRMMRAIRLSAQHSFLIENETYEAIKSNKSLIKNISQERFNKELSRTLISSNPHFVEKLYETGLAEFVMPELVAIFECSQNNPNHLRGDKPTTVGEHTIDVLKKAVEFGKENPIFNDLEVRLALLCHDFGKPSTKGSRNRKGYGDMDTFIGHPEVSERISNDFLKRLKYPKTTVANVSKLVKHHDIDLVNVKGDKVHVNGQAVRKAYANFGATRKETIALADKLLEKLFAVRKSDAAGQNPESIEGISFSSKEKVAHINEALEFIKNNKNIFDVIMPINGDDVRIALGLTPSGMKIYGRFVGDVLNKLQEKVIKDSRFLYKLEGDVAHATILSYAQSMGMKHIVAEEFLEG